jgi:hypothetical protein
LYGFVRQGLVCGVRRLVDLATGFAPTASAILAKQTQTKEQNVFGGGVLISTPRISAFLCDSAVISLYSTFTAETRRNAEIRREEL